MKKSIVLIYNMPPRGAPRPRVFKDKAGKSRGYNEQWYTDYKRDIRMVTKIDEPLQGAIKMAVMFQFKKPKSWSKKKRASAFWHTQKPDTDNLLKTIKDALNKLAYWDDSQICDLDAVKVWGDCDKIVVELEEIQ